MCRCGGKPPKLSVVRVFGGAISHFERVHAARATPSAASEQGAGADSGASAGFANVRAAGTGPRGRSDKSFAPERDTAADPEDQSES